MFPAILALIKAFCGGGVVVSLIILYFIMMKNLVAIDEKEKIHINTILKWIAIGFIIGGSLGILLV